MPGHPAPSRSARIIHLALTLGVALAVAVLGWVHSLGAGGVLDAAGGRVLRYVGIVVLVFGIVLAQAFRRRIPPLPAGEEEDAWWRAHMARAIVTWALSESVALTNAVFYFLTGDIVLLGIAALAVVLLWLTRPARLTAG